MELRYLIVYDKNGKDGEKTLQFRQTDKDSWQDVEIFRLSIQQIHPPYISTPYHSIGGWKVCLMKWTDDKDSLGPYYDVWNVSPGHRSAEAAARYGKDWAKAEDIKYTGD